MDIFIIIIVRPVKRIVSDREAHEYKIRKAKQYCENMFCLYLIGAVTQNIFLRLCQLDLAQWDSNIPY